MNQQKDIIRDARVLGTPKMLLLGLQHMFAMFGATILVPILVNSYFQSTSQVLSVQVTLFCAGFGTLFFHLCTKFKVPAFLGSSFAFLGGFSSVAALDTGIFANMADKEKLQYACGGIVVAGFTAKELMTALAVALVKFQEGKPFFVNCYPRVVTQDGSREAQLLVDEMMEACDCEWRGLGVIPKSGMKLRQEWQEFDARLKYQMPKIEGKPNPACRCGDVLQGKCKPSDCKVFGKGCTPQHPIGACMVSGEGACSAYYQYS